MLYWENKMVYSNLKSKLKILNYCNAMRGLGGVVGLMLPIACADCGSRPIYYLPCSDLGQVVNLSLSVACPAASG